ncbi:MAG: carboxypeptidase-like regulatory domain-containing protein [Puia sp.]|nr:carboxypeptidase-like regulatory domain-containing protein [Puia sp.]
MKPSLIIRFLFCAGAGLLLSLPLFSQDKYFTISGQVLDQKTGLPMPGASVFCQNTTMGTVSNNEGRFFLRMGNGGYDMVVSYTGYETKLLRVSNGSKNDSLHIELKEQDKSMGEVVVAGSALVADGWNKYGQFFFDNFIGTTPNAGKCTIENKEALKFYFYKKRNKLKVKCDSNLVIVNNALGYRIKYQLDSFVYEYGSDVGSSAGYPFFEELSGSPEQHETWKQNRLDTYLGSRLHFMRCWYDSTLHDEGFSIELLDSASNRYAPAFKDPYIDKIYSVDSGEVNININGRIRVTYTNRPSDKKYLSDFKFPADMKGQISLVDIIGGFTIDENGYFYDQTDLTNIGYWSWKKFAETLPYDYLPE